MPSRKQDRYFEALEEYLGKRVRAERIRLGLKQAQLAERADKSTKWISRIETQGDNVSLHSLAGLARGLGVEPGDLLPTSKTRTDSALAREAKMIIDDAEKASGNRHDLELMVKVLRLLNE